MFCAIGSERITFIGFEHCVSAHEALLLFAVTLITAIILVMLMQTVHSLHVWRLRRQLQQEKSRQSFIAHATSLE